MGHKVNINCTLWVYCGNDITRFYWPLQAAQESFIYGIFALCKVCGSKRLIIESLEPKKIILFLKQRLMFCQDDDDAHTIPVPSNIFFYILCFKRLVAISSRVMFLWSPAPGSALGCLLYRLCGLSAALWEEMRRPRSQNASQTHFLETRALSQNQFLWEMECQQSMILTKWVIPSPTLLASYRYYYQSQYAANELRPGL